jgi:hypothetical protein
MVQAWLADERLAPTQEDTMRKTLVLSLLVASLGIAGAARASDHSQAADRDGRSHVETDSRGDRHDRSERGERSRERHDEGRETRRESRERHDESRERGDRR